MHAHPRITRSRRALAAAVAATATVCSALAIGVPTLTSASATTRSDPTPLTDGAPREVIVFSTGYVAADPDVGSPSDVWRVAPDGSGLKRLTRSPKGSNAGAPDIAPSGGRIAYVTNTSGDYGVWTMNADGTDQHALLETAGYDYLQPRWSPNGQRLAISRCAKVPGFATDCDLVVTKADGSGLRVLVRGHRFHRAPVWSPDGTRIAFDSDRAGLVSTIGVVPSAGGPPTRLTKANLEAFWPSWSPDGSEILFSSNWGRPHSDVYVMRADGTRVRKVTETGSSTDVGGVFHASFSPDGEHLVAVSDTLADTDTRVELFTMSTDGSGVTRLAPGRWAFTPDWGIAGSAT